jgi:hypothetical protein
VPERGYGGVVIEGTDGTVTVSGLDFVNTLGVERRSERFTVSVDLPDGCDPIAATGLSFRSTDSRSRSSNNDP